MKNLLSSWLKNLCSNRPLIGALFLPILVSGCAQKEAPVVTKGAPIVVTPKLDVPAKTFTMAQMAGKWIGNAALDPRMTQDKRAKLLKVIGDLWLVLDDKKKTFILSNPTGNYTGAWIVYGQDVVMQAEKRGNQTVAEIQAELKKKGASPKQLAAMNEPAKLHISDDGTMLLSSTVQTGILITYKKG